MARTANYPMSRRTDCDTPPWLEKYSMEPGLRHVHWEISSPGLITTGPAPASPARPAPAASTRNGSRCPVVRAGRVYVLDALWVAGEHRRRIAALGGGFNRSTQHIADNVRRVFRSLVFSSVAHSTVKPQHQVWLATRSRDPSLWESTAAAAGWYFHSSHVARACVDHRSRLGCSWRA